MNVFLVNPVGGLDNLLNQALTDLKSTSFLIQNERTNSEIMEILGYVVNSLEPRDRIIRNPERKNNLVAQIAETVWIMGGCNSLKYLSPFLPRAIDFSDDGNTWRAGYGPRISNIKYTPPEGFFIKDNAAHFSEIYTEERKVNQLKNVFEILSADPSSRQAYIVVPLPGDNLMSNSTKDTPCTLSLQFIIRDDKLHCFTNMRSNDLIWGTSGINFFEWTFIQELLADLLQLEVGVYTHKAGSFHIYSRHYKMADKIMEAHQKVEDFEETNHLPVQCKNYEDFEETIKEYFSIFDDILENTEKDKTPLHTKIFNFYFRNTLSVYLAVPLWELLYQQQEFNQKELNQIKDMYRVCDYLFKGLLKSKRFFLKGKLNNLK